MKEQSITSKLLYVLMAVNVIILVAFLLVGYDTPYEENPAKVAPLMTDPLIIWSGFLIGGAILSTLWGLFNSLTTKGTGTVKEVGLAAHTNTIAWGLFGVSLVIGAVFGIMGQDEITLLNGKEHTPAENITAELFMISVAILVVATFLATCAAAAANFTSNKK